jgi:hypothetical protein
VERQREFCAVELRQMQDSSVAKRSCFIKSDMGF